MRRFAIAIFVGLSVGPALPAGEPSDLVPLTGPPLLGVGPAPPGFYRPSRWDVWQYYAVDRTGHWRPRVVLTPEPYYLYNGTPYGLLPVRPRDYMPYIFD
jgi:hypothetical protein